MRSMRRRVALGLLLLGSSEIAGARGPYPRVQVVAKLEGTLFEGVSKPVLAELESDLQKQVKKAADAAKSFSCMEWVTEGGAARDDIQAHLFIILTQKRYGENWLIDLSLSGAVKDSQPVTLWTQPAVASSLDWSPRNVQGLKERVYPVIAALFKKQELRGIFDANFIAYIPIAKSIEVDAQGHRVIVPLNARRLNLEPETLLKLTLMASLCPLKPEKCSNMDLRSEGAGSGIRDPLRCRIESSDCCASDWPPGFADRLERSKDNVKVFLLGDHRHCPFGPDNCPGPALSRHRGTFR
ncbi:MAG: hypothetical protein WAM82_00230 [Thermoanaerobaculia bacterium]